MHVQNRKAKSSKQRRREQRNTTYRLYLLFLHLFLSVYVCCQASVECQSYPHCTLQHSTSFPSSIVPLDVSQSLLKPASLRLLAIQKRPSLFSHSTHQKSVQKGEEKKRRRNATSHHQIFSVLNLHTRSILLCLLFVTAAKYRLAFVFH